VESIKMSHLSDILNSIHGILVVLFVATTFLLLAATLVNRFRLRRIVLTWAGGRLFGFPLLPSLFLLAMGGIFVYFYMGGNASSPMQPWLLAGYILGGVQWYVAALVSNSIIVTEYGIIQSVNRMSKAISWNQIVDYVTHESQRKTAYIFFVLNDKGRKERVELEVPKQQVARFSETVKQRVDARFDFSTQQSYGTKALNL